MKKNQGNLFGEMEMEFQTVVNVSSVPQRSPFRYPGGKTWLIPVVRKWLMQEKKSVKVLIEPFAGGGIVSLTAAFEDLAKKVIMAELDEEIAAVWQVILNGNNAWLSDRIINFDLTRENVNAEIIRPNKSLRETAFCTILKNRTYHGGIIAKGSGLLKHGENGKGIASRWYPKTLKQRIDAIGLIKEKIEFITGDAFALMKKHQSKKTAYTFIDPPYVKAGKRLYTCFEVDHENLFKQASQLKGKFLMTYDDHSDIRDLAKKYSLAFTTIPMKTTHHLEKQEILISDNLDWIS